jgi:hypothetical protein
MKSAAENGSAAGHQAGCGPNHAWWLSPNNSGE